MQVRIKKIGGRKDFGRPRKSGSLGATFERTDVLEDLKDRLSFLVLAASKLVSDSRIMAIRPQIYEAGPVSARLSSVFLKLALRSDGVPFGLIFLRDFVLPITGILIE